MMAATRHNDDDDGGIGGLPFDIAILPLLFSAAFYTSIFLVVVAVIVITGCKTI